MNSLNLTSVAQWNKVGDQFWRPASVNAHCGHCAEKVSFALEGPMVFGVVPAVLQHSLCPNCRQKVLFIAIEPGPADDKSKMTCAELVMYPAPKSPRKTVEGSDLLPPELAAAYREAIDVFNAKAWRATATTCRVTLEGIVSNLAPTATGALHQKLSTLSDHVDLTKPLQKLTDLIRRAGNLGAHFDSANPPTREMAEAQLRLVEYLLEYVYTLPKLIDSLDKELTK